MPGVLIARKKSSPLIDGEIVFCFLFGCVFVWLLNLESYFTSSQPYSSWLSTTGIPHHC